MLRTHALLWISATLFLGCGPAGPTYDEAIQTYKTELDLLTSLEREKTAALFPLDREDRERLAELERFRQYDTRLKKVFQTDFNADAIRSIEQERQQIAAKRAEIDRRYADPISAQRARVQKALEVKENAEKHR